MQNIERCLRNIFQYGYFIRVVGTLNLDRGLVEARYVLYHIQSTTISH